MRAFQCGCLSAVVRAVLFAECLPTCARGDGASSDEKLDIKYVLIGLGIGLFLAALFILVKCYIIWNHVDDNTVGSHKRPSEPNILALSHVSQSENRSASISASVEGQAQ